MAEFDLVIRGGTVVTAADWPGPRPRSAAPAYQSEPAESVRSCMVMPSASSRHR